jgi:ABC-type glycerol-3-phosphate transport system substrate-binding protein
MPRLDLLVSTFLVVLTLVACTPDVPPPTTPTLGAVSPTSFAPSTAIVPAAPASSDGDRVTITFALFEDERAVVEPLVAAFEEQNSNIHVQLVMLDPIFARGEPPDYERVVLSAADTTSFPMSPAAITNGWVRDLTRLAFR